MPMAGLLRTPSSSKKYHALRRINRPPYYIFSARTAFFLPFPLRRATPGGSYAREGVAVVRILGAADAVPPGEIQAVISSFGTVVQIVMRVRRQYAEHPMRRGAPWKQFEAAMADNIADDHVNHEQVNDADMERQDKNKQGQKHCLNHGFQRREGIGRPGRRAVRFVMQPMK